MRVLSVASELFPLIKTGGLADVAGALPGALATLGVEMRTLLPGYPAVLAGLPDPEIVHEQELMGGQARLLAGRIAGDIQLLVLDAPHLFDRPGNPYLGPRRGRLAGQSPPLRGPVPHRRRYRPGLPARLAAGADPRP